jgi:hypothetical protein
MAEAATALDYRGNVTIPAEASNEGSASAPAAGTAIASISLAPGTYTLGWTVGLDSGSPASADTNNFGLYAGATLEGQSVNPAALGSWAQQAVEITLTATTTVAVKAVGSATAAVVYAADVTATPVLETDEDAQLQPYNPLTADGTSVTLGSGQSVTLNGFDAASAQAECQLGRGGNLPSGSTDYGFVDTTYTLTSAQVAAGSLMGA